MAIDEITGKRIKTHKTSLDIEREKKEKAMPKFDTNYEEELKKQLFADFEAEKVVEDIFDEPEEVIGHHERPGEEWDVPITEDILYFDPELSYELTGYRPINMTKGLDFDPEPFREMAKLFEEKGKYTEFPEGSKPWRDFWNQEVNKMNNGLTIGKYRITGDMYYYLNYYRMQTITNDYAKAGEGRSENFPSFLSKQYEWFHYFEMAEKLHKDAAILKTRGCGLSECTAAMSVRPYTTKPNYKVLLTSEADDKLQPLRDKCWLQLDWLNMNTCGGLRHVRQKMNNNETKRASKVTRDGIEFGWGSEIRTIVADNPNKVRGDRTDRLIYEEAGSSKNLAKAWIQGAALVELGGTHFGTRLALGTGGDEIALDGLSSIFSNPEGFNVLPFKNYDTYDGKPSITAFFLPAHKFALKKEFLDNRGVTNTPLLREYYEKQRSKLSGRDYTNECAEHCFTPEEALAKTGANVFDGELIAQQMTNLRVHDHSEPVPTILEWDDKSPKYSKVNSYPSKSSKLLVLEQPIRDPDGNVYKNLYVAGIDAIDVGSDNSAMDNDVSDFCIVIKRRVFGDQEPKYVAIYKDRPRDIRAAYMIALKLLTWYNCQAMLEYTKISFQQFLIERKKESLLMSRPEYAVSVKNKFRRNTKRLIGVPGTEAVIKHGLELISAFLSDYYYTIEFPEMLEELLKYTYENKRKFDIVAALSCCEIGDEALTGITPVKQTNITKDSWQDVGYYTDENGYRRYGRIPSKNTLLWPN